MSRLALAIAVRGRWEADKLAQQLAAAGVPAGAEVHIACDPDFAPTTPSRSFFVHTLADASLFELWALAIGKSRSPWVAILHAYAPPAPGWFLAMDREIERLAWNDGYWGPVELKDDGPPGSMIGYLIEYCQFHRPLEAGMTEIPGSNLVLPRERIATTRSFSKTRLLGEGLAPRYVPDAVVLYARPVAFWGYCLRRLRHGRAYAAARTPRLPLIQALLLSAALPFVRTARILRHAWRHKRLRGASLAYLPAIVIAETCWSLGEIVGYVTRRPGASAALD